MQQSGKSSICRDHRLDCSIHGSFVPCCVGRKSLPFLFSIFSLCELECLPVSLSNATGMFEYSGQEVKKHTSSSPRLLCTCCYQCPERFTVMEDNRLIFTFCLYLIYTCESLVKIQYMNTAVSCMLMHTGTSTEARTISMTLSCLVFSAKWSSLSHTHRYVTVLSLILFLYRFLVTAELYFHYSFVSPFILFF